jgi:hypothetical protein
MRVVWAFVAFTGAGAVGLLIVLPRLRWLRPRRVLTCELCQRRHRRLLAAMVALAALSVAGFGLRVSQRARELPACVADISIAEGREVTDPVVPPRGSAWSTARSVLTAPVSGLALGFAEVRGRGLCSVGEPPITLAFVPEAKDRPGSMVGEVFLASPRPRINAVRAGELARHESRHGTSGRSAASSAASPCSRRPTSSTRPSIPTPRTTSSSRPAWMPVATPLRRFPRLVHARGRWPCG